MSILSSLAALLLLPISIFSLSENSNSFSASNSLWLEIKEEKSFALSVVHSNLTTFEPGDERFQREKAVHDMRTAVYTTEVGFTSGCVFVDCLHLLLPT